MNRIVGAADNEALSCLPIFIRCDAALCHIGQTFFPACRQLRVEKLLHGGVYDLINQLSQIGWRDDLRFFVERHVFDVEQLFQDLRAGCTRSDAAALDLGAQLFVFDKLTGICLLYTSPSPRDLT